MWSPGEDGHQFGNWTSRRCRRSNPATPRTTAATSHSTEWGLVQRTHRASTHAASADAFSSSAPVIFVVTRSQQKLSALRGIVRRWLSGSVSVSEQRRADLQLTCAASRATLVTVAMKSAGTWNVALGVAVLWLVVLVVAMAVLIGPVQDAEKDHITSFAPTTVMVVASGKAKYRCADVFNCQCAEVPTAPTCGDINHEGVCSYVVAEPESLPMCQYSRCMPRLLQGRLLLLQV